MPASPEPGLDRETETQPAGIGLAIAAEALYLANLLVIPVIAFLILGALFLRRDRDTPPLAAAHIEQTFAASLWAGILLVIVNGVIILAGGYHSPWVWVIVGVYFTTCHSALVILGILGLAKAMAGQGFHFPVVGTFRCDVC